MESGWVFIRLIDGLFWLAAWIGIIGGPILLVVGMAQYSAKGNAFYLVRGVRYLAFGIANRLLFLMWRIGWDVTQVPNGADSHVIGLILTLPLVWLLPLVVCTEGVDRCLRKSFDLKAGPKIVTRKGPLVLHAEDTIRPQRDPEIPPPTRIDERVAILGAQTQAANSPEVASPVKDSGMGKQCQSGYAHESPLQGTEYWLSRDGRVYGPHDHRTVMTTALPTDKVNAGEAWISLVDHPDFSKYLHGSTQEEVAPPARVSSAALKPGMKASPASQQPALAAVLLGLVALGAIGVGLYAKHEGFFDRKKDWRISYNWQDQVGIPNVVLNMVATHEGEEVHLAVRISPYVQKVEEYVSKYYVEALLITEDGHTLGIPFGRARFTPLGEDGVQEGSAKCSKEFFNGIKECRLNWSPASTEPAKWGAISYWGSQWTLTTKWDDGVLRYIIGIDPCSIELRTYLQRTLLLTLKFKDADGFEVESLVVDTRTEFDFFASSAEANGSYPMSLERYKKLASWNFEP